MYSRRPIIQNGPHPVTYLGEACRGARGDQRRHGRVLDSTDGVFKPSNGAGLGKSGRIIASTRSHRRGERLARPPHLPTEAAKVLSFWRDANRRIAAQRSALRQSLPKPGLFATPHQKTTCDRFSLWPAQRQLKDRPHTDTATCRSETWDEFRVNATGQSSTHLCIRSEGRQHDQVWRTARA